MDTSRSTPTPEQVAEAIADAEPVDWPACESSPAWPAAQVDGLRRVEAVAAAFRTAVAAPLDGEGEAVRTPPLFVWGSLEVLEKLGEGSFGEVFRARDEVLQREVALKLHRPGVSRRLAARADFLGEARRLARVRHPNVVVVHGADEHNGRTGLWLDLIDGCTLTELARQSGPLGPGEATAVAMDLCGAVAAVHAAGLVHADIKPSNVMRERGGRIVLMDFGAGVDLTPEVPSGPVCGTPAVMAPEVLRGEVPTPATDVYSLGALLYFLLTGRYPVEAETLAELAARQQRGESVPLADRRPDVPDSLLKVIEKALDPARERRFASAGELRRALARIANASETAKVPTARARRATLLRVAAAFLAGGAGLAGGVIALKGLTARSHSIGGGELTPSLAVEATLYRDGPEGAVPLAGRQTVRPGERLFLTVTAPEEIHLYVLNQDEGGQVFVLFPVPGLEPGNPLPPRTRHRLPGELNGQSQDWVVTSAGGQERFLLVAARRPLVEIEGELTLLALASPSRVVDPMHAARSEVALRGVGGLAASPADTAQAQRMQRLRQLVVELAERGEVWMNEVIVENPTS